MPSESPVIVQLVVAVAHVAPPFAVAVYPVIVDPPSETGAVQVMTDCRVAPALAVTEVGAPGLPAVVAEAEAEAADVPFELVAVTVNVYEVPFANEVTVQLVVAVVQVCPPLEVTVYPVIEEPPSLGAVQVTTDCAVALDVAATLVGALGFVETTTTSGSEVIKTVTVPFCVAVPNNVATPLTIP